MSNQMIHCWSHMNQMIHWNHKNQTIQMREKILGNEYSPPENQIH